MLEDDLDIPFDDITSNYTKLKNKLVHICIMNELEYRKKTEGCDYYYRLDNPVLNENKYIIDGSTIKIETKKKGAIQVDVFFKKEHYILLEVEESIEYNTKRLRREYISKTNLIKNLIDSNGYGVSLNYDVDGNHYSSLREIEDYYRIGMFDIEKTSFRMLQLLYSMILVLVTSILPINISLVANKIYRHWPYLMYVLPLVLIILGIYICAIFVMVITKSKLVNHFQELFDNPIGVAACIALMSLFMTNFFQIMTFKGILATMEEINNFEIISNISVFIAILMSMPCYYFVSMIVFKTDLVSKDKFLKKGMDFASVIYLGLIIITFYLKAVGQTTFTIDDSNFDVDAIQNAVIGAFAILLALKTLTGKYASKLL